jgi:predicted Mrr-cat superfamily restriction endonuclease
MTRLWLIRLGKNGEYEEAAIDENVLTIDFGIGEDISQYKDREALIAKMALLFPNDKPNRHRNFAAQVNQFANIAQDGDLVVSPLKTSSTIAIGRIAGPCTPGPNGETRRRVQWLKTDIPRDVFRQDFLYSFGAFMTVCEISRNDALQRVLAMLQNGRDPGSGTTTTGNMTNTHADHGLIVSWGGFTSAVRRRTNELFFRVRLWGREELLDNLLASYERLPEDIRAELPLKRIWTLVLEEEGHGEP